MSSPLYRSLIILFLFCTLMRGASAGSGSANVSYQKKWISRTRVHLITANLNDPTLLVTPAIAYDKPGRRQSFLGFLVVHQPLAQVTGSYFSMQSNLPVGDIVIGGKLRYLGPAGSALAITPDNTPAIINIPYGWKYSWPGYETVLQGGVRLVQHGKFAVYPRQHGFRDPGIFRKATRTAVGIKPNKRLVLVGINKPVQLSELAGIMKGMGCTDAMTLDGGTSTGIAYGSSIIINPGRTLATVLQIVRRPPPPAPAPAVTTPTAPAEDCDR